MTKETLSLNNINTFTPCEVVCALMNAKKVQFSTRHCWLRLQKPPEVTLPSDHLMPVSNQLLCGQTKFAFLW